MKDKTVNIETEAHHKLKVHCAKIDCQVGDFTEAAIEEKIHREPSI